MIDKDMSLAIVPVGDTAGKDSIQNKAESDSRQGKEKKHRSEKTASKPKEGKGSLSQAQENEKIDAGLPIQPCNDQ